MGITEIVPHSTCLWFQQKWGGRDGQKHSSLHPSLHNIQSWDKNKICTSMPVREARVQPSKTFAGCRESKGMCESCWLVAHTCTRGPAELVSSSGQPRTQALGRVASVSVPIWSHYYNHTVMGLLPISGSCPSLRFSVIPAWSPQPCHSRISATVGLNW